MRVHELQKLLESTSQESEVYFVFFEQDGSEWGVNLRKFSIEGFGISYSEGIFQLVGEEQ
jgi:hypothetical protein